MNELATVKSTPTETAASTETDELSRPDFKATVLLVEDDGIVSQDLYETITRLGYAVVGIAAEGFEAISMAERMEPHLIVMDVGLRGRVDGIEAARIIQRRTHVPVIFLTGHRDAQTLERAVQTGPLGYLVKPFQEIELRCAIEVALHKHRADEATREREDALRRNAELLASLSLEDELTRLKNRRAFFELGRQALKVAHRERGSVALFFIDLNGLKQINDRLGHLAGDEALRDAADVLRKTFRESDIVARYGGDEFVVLATGIVDTQVLCERLREQIRDFNAYSTKLYRLDMSVGTAVAHATADADIPEIEALIASADKEMYHDKRQTLDPIVE